MPRRGRVLVVVVMVAALSAFATLAGCGSADVGTSGPARDTTASPTAAAAPEGATSARHGPQHRQSGTIRLAGGRHYVLPDQDPPPPGTLRPLLIVLHSFGGTWMRLERVARFQERARAHGLVVAYAIGRERSWNAGRCCGWAESQQVDDVAYLVDLVADLRVRMPGIDQRRIYLTGFSNGAMMTLRALCERPDVFAAGAGVAGALVSHCRAGTPIHYLAVHGTADQVVPYHGGTIDWLGVTFRPVRELPVRIRQRVPGSVVEVRTHRCGHVWPTVRERGVDAAGVGLAFVRRFSVDASGSHRATGAKTRRSRHSELW